MTNRHITALCFAGKRLPTAALCNVTIDIPCNTGLVPHAGCAINWATGQLIFQNGFAVCEDGIGFTAVGDRDRPVEGYACRGRAAAVVAFGHFQIRS